MNEASSSFKTKSSSFFSTSLSSDKRHSAFVTVQHLKPDTCLNTKSLIYFLSPRGFYRQIEASPLGGRLVRGAFWSLAGSLISRSLGLLSAILVGRLLGKEAFGELGIIQNTVGMFGTLAGFGMGLTANKHVAEFKRTAPAHAGRIIALAGATAWITSGFMAVVLLVLGPWLAAETLAAPHLGGLLQVGGVLLFLSGINGAQTGALSGFEAFKAIASINLISGLLTFPLMVTGALYWGVAGAVWGLIGSQLANCLLCFVALRAEAARFQIPIRLSGALAESKLFWSFSFPAVLTGVLNSAVAWGASALVVNQAGGYGDMGIYNAALRVKLLPETFLAMLIAPMLPILSEAFGKGDRDTFQRTLQFNFLLATLIIVPVSLVQAAAPALTLMSFGPQYQGDPVVVLWLMLHAVLYALMFPMGSVLISMGRMWFSLVINGIFAVLFGAAALLLVPRYGAAGYAASMTVAYGLANLPSVVFLYQQLPAVMNYLRWGLVAAVGILLFVACIMAFQQLPFAWGTVAGFLAAAAFVALKYHLHSAAMMKLANPSVLVGTSSCTEATPKCSLG